MKDYISFGCNLKSELCQRMLNTDVYTLYMVLVARLKKMNTLLKSQRQYNVKNSKEDKKHGANELYPRMVLKYTNAVLRVNS